MARPRRVPRFDPYGVLTALERERVAYVLIGGLARVIVGSDEITHGVDLTPSTKEENLRRLGAALEAIHARRPDGGEPAIQTTDFELEPLVELETDSGEVKIVPFPEGTRGFDDLRRDAERQPIGRGHRPLVASTRDLARMLSPMERPEDVRRLMTMRRLMELEHGLHREPSIEI